MTPRMQRSRLVLLVVAGATVGCESAVTMETSALLVDGRQENGTLLLGYLPDDQPAAFQLGGALKGRTSLTLSIGEKTGRLVGSLAGGGTVGGRELEGVTLSGRMVGGDAAAVLVKIVEVKPAPPEVDDTGDTELYQVMRWDGSGWAAPLCAENSVGVD